MGNVDDEPEPPVRTLPLIQLLSERPHRRVRDVAEQQHAALGLALSVVLHELTTLAGEREDLLVVVEDERPTPLGGPQRRDELGEAVQVEVHRGDGEDVPLVVEDRRRARDPGDAEVEPQVRSGPDPTLLLDGLLPPRPLPRIEAVIRDLAVELQRVVVVDDEIARERLPGPAVPAPRVDEPPLAVIRADIQ